jgi:hypothetical protein
MKSGVSFIPVNFSATPMWSPFIAPSYFDLFYFIIEKYIHFACGSARVWNLASDIKVGT